MILLRTTWLNNHSTYVQCIIKILKSIHLFKNTWISMIYQVLCKVNLYLLTLFKLCGKFGPISLKKKKSYGYLPVTRKKKIQHSFSKKCQQSWQLNAMCNPGWDPKQNMKGKSEAVGATSKSWMGVSGWNGSLVSVLISICQ